MTTEIQPPEGFDTTDTPMPGLVLVDPPADKADAKTESKPAKVEKVAGKAKVKEGEEDDETGSARGHSMTKEMREVQSKEDTAIKDILDDLGEAGSFRIKLSRMEPEEFLDPVSRTRVKTAGHLRDYFEKVDETLIQKNHGGGRYKLQVFKKNGQGGKMTFATSRVVDVTGDPRLDDVPRTIPAAPSSGPAVVMPPAEDGKVATAALGMAERMMERVASVQPPPADHRPYEMMIEAQGKQIEAQRAEMAQLRQMVATAAQTPKNPLEDRLMTKLIDEDSARINALRVQHESEIRMIREGHAQELRALEQRMDRLMSDQKASFEREIASMKSFGDIMRSTQATASDANLKVLEGRIKSLEREVDVKDKELLELRAKKDKSVIEQLKDMKAVKDAFADDEEAESSTADKIIEALPQVIPQVQGFFGKGPQAAPAPAPQVAAPPKRQVLRGPDGNKYLQQGNQLVLVTPKRAPAVPGEPVIPQVAPQTVAQIVNYLERAVEGGQDPAVVVQSIRPMIAGQEEILQAVRALGGVDAFLAKVANLPSSSPLLTQAGKNWVRKFSKDLVGD